MGFKVKYQWNKQSYTLKNLSINSKVSQLLSSIYATTFNGSRTTKLIMTFGGVELSIMEKTLAFYNFKKEKNRIVVAIANNDGSKFPSNIKTTKTTCVLYNMTYICAKIECGCYMSNKGVTIFIENSCNHNDFLKCPKCKKILNNLDKIFYLANYDDDDKEDKLYDLLSKRYRILSKDEHNLGLSVCPGCNTTNKRPKSLNQYRVACGLCGKNYCYECETLWKKSGFQLCGNKDCETWEIQDDLTNCPPLPYKDRWDWVKTFNEKYAKNNTKEMIPSLRACPGCLNLLCVINNCRHITCNSCKHEFCYVCLKNWSDHSTTTCDKTKPAPRQILN